MRFLFASVASVALVVAGCRGAPGDDTSTSATVVDSAGVRLVHNTSRAADTAAVDVIEDLRIGVVDGDAAYQFFRIADVKTEAEGRIFVADQGDDAVRVFDRDGRFVRGFGRRGQGPGEFTLAFNMFVWRDTVHVANRGGRAGSSVLFDTAGTLLGTFPQLLPNGSSIVPLAGTPSGWLVYDDSLFARQAREQAGDITRAVTTIARIAPQLLEAATRSRAAADSLLEPVTSYLRGRIFWELGSEGGSERFPLGNPPFFEPSPTSAVDGRGFVHVAPGWPYVISTYDATGALVRRITRAHDSIPVDDALMDELMRRVRAHFDTLRNARGASVANYEKRLAYPRIGFVPVTGTILASTDGWLWVRRPDLEPDPVALAFSTGLPPRPSYWDVFDVDGILRHTVRLPPGFSARAVSSESVVGVLRDAMDVQHVARFRISRAARDQQ